MQLSPTARAYLPLSVLQTTGLWLLAILAPKGGVYLPVVAVAASMPIFMHATVHSPVLRGNVGRDDWLLRIGLIIAAIATVVFLSFLGLPKHVAVIFTIAASLSLLATLLIGLRQAVQ